MTINIFRYAVNISEDLFHLSKNYPINVALSAYIKNASANKLNLLQIIREGLCLSESFLYSLFVAFLK